MNIYESTERDSALIERLTSIWEASVRATHLFLSHSEIAEIKKYVPQALSEIPHLVVAETADGNPSAFMGIADRKLEMLFISPAERGKGLGKKLINYGINVFSVNEVTVNEQNSPARGFYEHMGFSAYKRSELDEQGGRHPILYMRLCSEK